MRDFERKYVESLVDNLSASIAQNVREVVGPEEFVESDEELTDPGKMYVRGYIVGRLSVLRANEGVNPNLTESEMAEILSIVDENEPAIAAALYA